MPLDTVLDNIEELFKKRPKARTVPLIDDAGPPYGISLPRPPHQEQQQLTVSNDLALSVTLFGSVATSILMTGYVAHPNGALTPIGPNGGGYAFQMQPDRTPRSAQFSFGSNVELKGLSLVAVASAAVPVVPVGSVWAIVQRIVFLPNATTAVVETLVSGPVTINQVLGIGSPIRTSLEVGGFIHALLLPDPGVNSEFRFTVPTGARMEILGSQLSFNASAVNGNRRPVLVWSMSGQQLGASAQVSDTAFSQMGVYNWEPGLPLTAPIVAGVNVAGLPNELILLAGDFVATQTAGIQLGDFYNHTILEVREWLEP